jgi:chaperonin cofactor prefoldin
MTQKNGLSLTDPIGNLRSLRDAVLDSWAKAMIDTVNTETFARSLGAYLDASLAAAAPIQQAVDQYMKSALPRLSMPLRDDITTLAKRMTTIEMRLDDIEVKIDQIGHALRNQTPVLVEMLEEQLGKSQATNGASEEIDELEGRLKTLDSKTDKLLHMLERMQAPAPAPAAPKRLRKQPVVEAPEPPTPAEVKEDKAIRDF